MRAGQLNRTVTIERTATTVDDFGTPIEEWAEVATVRAQVIQATSEEFMRSFGAGSEIVVIFRIRHMDGITLADRVKEGGAIFDIKEIKELGRRKGIEIRTIRAGG